MSISCSSNMVKALIEVITIGLQRNKLEEVEALIAAVRVLRPGIKTLEPFDACLAFGRGQFHDAAHILRVADREKSPMSNALLAYCLFANGDPEWEIVANKVIDAATDPDAVTIAKLLGHSCPVSGTDCNISDTPELHSVDVLENNFLRG